MDCGIKTPLNLPSGQAFSGLQIVLTDKSTAITGHVSDAHGVAVTDASVVVFPADAARWTYQSRFIRSVRPDQDGRFEIRGLPAAGQYLAIALHGLEDGQAGDPELLERLRDQATVFALTDGETRTLDLRLELRQK